MGGFQDELRNLSLDERGRAILSDGVLAEIEDCIYTTSAGANPINCAGSGNGNCTNSGLCTNTTNTGTCSNATACTGSSNSRCGVRRELGDEVL